jgi:phytoene dehydrogenase-like protein
MSTLDPHTTFLDLVGAENLSANLKESIEGWKYDKWSYYTLHVAANEQPHYACDDLWINEAFMTIFGIESTDQLLSHWDNVVSGNISDNFGGHATCESFFDPTLSDIPGKNISFFQMHAPYEIEGGWEERGKELEEAVLAKWQKVAPNMTKNNIITTTFETPVDIETRFPNMRRGSIKHGDYRPIQMGCFRPNQDCSSTATPIEGLYVCGVSTYPGGLVLGGPGYLGANKVAEDLGVTKWWKPTPEIEKYVKTYLE